MEPLPPEPPEPLPVLLDAAPLPGLTPPLADPLETPDPGADAKPLDEPPPPDDTEAPADADPPALPAEPFPLLIVAPLAEPPLAGAMVPLAAPALPPEPRPEVTPLFASVADVPIEELPQPVKKAAERKHATLDRDLFELIFTRLEEGPSSGASGLVVVNERLARVKSRELDTTAQIGGKIVSRVNASSGLVESARDEAPHGGASAERSG